MSSTPRVRRSLSDIQYDYDHGKKDELEALILAWKGIKDLPASHPNSFFSIGGLHGEPFRGKGKTDAKWWGGYCQHGTVLFPSWHRAYLWRLEEALRSIPGCSNVTLPFWDECSEHSRENGLPSALTQEHFVIGGRKIDNPLRSFVFPQAIIDELPVTSDNPIIYSKPEGYETVRYPLSGLVGTPADREATKLHNAQFKDPAQNIDYLNKNISAWLNGQIIIEGNQYPEVFSSFESCLDAPNYTLFSNTTSAGAKNDADPKGPQSVPLESPHNYMHLAVGGFDYPNVGTDSVIPGANGDMGENETAGLDPIFFFHHCFIDYVFWTWQRRQGATDEFSIDPTDPGATYHPDAGVPPPAGPAGENPNATLSLDSTLDPFAKADGTAFTTRDCINIEKQLGYIYGKGSLDAYAQPTKQLLFKAKAVQPASKALRVSRINRAKIRGSFLISAYAEVDGQRVYLGTRPILSRWHVEGCMNCQTHLEATAIFKLPLNADASAIDENSIEVEVTTRETVLKRPKAAGLLSAGNAIADAPFKLEIY
ncbi:tyrosinase family protein [Pseudomonas gingeri]|uniref:tyrosinase family protein n=1 Tax=Pseudomonas gingeri TaxID=117681 RepID=UPI00159FE229|nr:tyrosinase family protein [Pseudomonas gingeri]NWA04832.1 tyrosinase family protein [Pseudomonas gingeri]NWA17713.1 tyrosinase family protein [Pseudomonas gingeri]NWA56879.1 tyrosinase family protein [Pseudomonas gingeri]NWA97255.1 tyrosinase family protein [Pseudomonas gingeri]NWB01693.1 tyrosinase family protein [Pseudomonas gingeri]